MIKFLFTGDISITGTFKKNLLAGKEIFTDDLKKQIHSHHFVVCNFEGPATYAKNILRQDIEVVSPPKSVEYLVQSGFNIFNLANNHIFDCDIKGFLETREAIIKNSANYFGAGENIQEASRVLYIEKDGIKIALIGVCHHEGPVAGNDAHGIFCETEENIIKYKVNEARQNADWVILNYHGGEEYTTIPMPRRRKLFHKYLSWDIDILVAHHPHVFQGCEVINGKPVFYSLGNFVFDIEAHKSMELTYKSALLSLKFLKENYSYEFTPVEIDVRLGQTKIGENIFLEHIQKLSSFTHYKELWFQDAYRAFFQPNKRIITNNNIQRQNVLRDKKSLILAAINIRYYRGLYKILRAKNSRPIFLGALQHIIRKKLRLNHD